MKFRNNTIESATTATGHNNKLYWYENHEPHIYNFDQDI